MSNIIVLSSYTTCNKKHLMLIGLTKYVCYAMVNLSCINQLNCALPNFKFLQIHILL